MRKIAIIPARSGSKGLKNKNVKLLNGKPLLAYTIEAAIKSKVFDTIMVSTDSIKYANIAKKYGAEVPFLRSKKNSSDGATTQDVILEVLDSYNKIGLSFDAFCILQPTSPLRTYKDIIGAYNLFIEKAKVAVVSVCEVDHSPLWCNTLKKNLSIDNFINKSIVNKRRQNLNNYYRVNGAIYFVYIKEYLKNSLFYRKGSFAYIMERYKSIDIDNIEDFNYVEYIMNKYKI